MVLNDQAIRYLSNGQTPNAFALSRDFCFKPERPLLSPFSEGIQSEGVISYGLSHAGYDLRLGQHLLLFKNSYNELVNPKSFKSEDYRNRVFDKISPTHRHNGICVQDSFVIPGHSYALGVSIERISMPNWLKGTCVGKSTLARCGILINTTPLEPGWEGYLTIEISNIGPCPALVFANEGIAQLEFHVLNASCIKDYGAKEGKYQNQGAEPTPARVKEDHDHERIPD